MGENGLKRELGLFTATCIVVANMIGAGIFVTSGAMAELLPGPLFVIALWFCGGLIAIAGALSYAELSTRMPRAGGEYIYLRELYGPLPAFLTGWTSFVVGFSAAIALSAFAFMEYLFAGLEHSIAVDESISVWIKKSGAILIIAVFTALHYLGLKLGARVQNSLTIVKIALLFCLIVLGIWLGRGGPEKIVFIDEASSKNWAFGAALLMVMYSYSGWNASAYIAGELKRPRRTLPVSLLLGTLIVMLLYIAVNALIFYIAPYDALKDEYAVMERAAVTGVGNWMADILSGMIGVALLSSLSAYVLIGPRVYYAMARDRLFFRFAGKVHSKYGVPGQAILMQGLVAAVMVTIGSIEQLLIYVGFALGIFPWMAIFGLFIARRRKVGEDIAYKVWWYPLVPIFYLLFSAVLMMVALTEKPLESSAAVLTVLLGIPCYFLCVRKRLSAKEGTT